MQTVGGRYALDGPLGEGGMGQVYRARHLQLGKAFALKIISPTFATDNAARQRFNQEAKLASEISHPNIVSVVDFGEDEQYGAYMVMELVEGDSLVADGSLPMSVKRALDVLAQVGDALDHIHKRGIIHGDVKADNIMLTAEQAVSAATGARRRRVVSLRAQHGDGHARHGAPPRTRQWRDPGRQPARHDDRPGVRALAAAASTRLDRRHDRLREPRVREARRPGGQGRGWDGDL